MAMDDDNEMSPVTTDRQRRLATDLAAHVEKAQTKPAEDWTIQDLEALAAAWG
jgi:hypothetical protein